MQKGKSDLHQRAQPVFGGRSFAVRLMQDRSQVGTASFAAVQHPEVGTTPIKAAELELSWGSHAGLCQERTMRCAGPARGQQGSGGHLQVFNQVQRVQAPFAKIAKSAGRGRRSPSLDLTGAQDLIFSHLIFSFNIFPEFSISGEKKKILFSCFSLIWDENEMLKYSSAPRRRLAALLLELCARSQAGCVPGLLLVSVSSPCPPDPRSSVGPG